MKKYISLMIMTIFILLVSTSVYAENMTDTIDDNTLDHSIKKVDTGSYKESATSLKQEFEKAKSSSNKTYNIQLDSNKTYEVTEELEVNDGKSHNIIIDGKGSTIKTINSSFMSIAENNTLTLSNINFKNVLAENYTYERENYFGELDESTVMYFIRNEGKLTLNNITIDNTDAYYVIDTLESINSQLTVNNVKVIEKDFGGSDGPNLWFASSNITVNNLTLSNAINFWIMESNITLNNSNINFSKNYNERYILTSNITSNNSTIRNIRTSIQESKIMLNTSTIDGYYFDVGDSQLSALNSRLMFANPLNPYAIRLYNSKLYISKSNIISNGAINKSLIYPVGSSINIQDTNFLNNKVNGALITSYDSVMLLNNNNFANNTVIGVGLIEEYFTDSNITSNVFEHNMIQKSYDIYTQNSNVNITNNIFRNYADNTIIKIINNTKTNLNANWWSTNTPNIQKIVDGANVSNWRILTFLNKSSLSKSPVKTEAGLYKLSNGLNATGNMALAEVTYIADSGKFDKEKQNLTKSVNNTYTGDANEIYVKLDNQTEKLSNKIDPVLMAENITVNTNDKIAVNIKTSDDATGNITFSGYGINYTRKITNASISFKLNVNIAGGEYLFKIRYNGDQKYQTKEIDFLVTVLNNQTITPTKTYKINESKITLPSRYDLRDYKQVTPIKNQDNEGACVSFASIAATESAIIKQTGKTYDLSENNMYFVLKNMVDDDDSLLYSGVRSLHTIGYLTSWMGPVLETQDSYYDLSLISPRLDAALHIQDVYIIPNRKNISDNNLIKEAIMKYGAVYSEITIDQENFIQYQNETYLYNNGLADANHAIAIVGWDDNFDKNKFKVSYENKTYTPKNNGAFIIKNSWGTDYGDNGYYYVSYEDEVIGGVNTAKLSNYVIIYNKTAQYDNIYQYEDINDVIIATNNKQIWYNDVYTVKDDEIIAAVGTILLNNNYNYTVSIYVDETLKHTQSGQINTMGYRTIPLTKYITVNKNQNVTVILHITSANDIEIVTSNTNLTQRNSRISMDGKTWNNILDSSWYYSTDNNRIQAAPLKLYTINNPKISTTAKIDNNKLVIKTTSNTDSPISYKLANMTINTKTNTETILNITNKMNNTKLITTYTDSNIKIQENQTITIPPRIEVTTNKKTVKMGETITLTATKIGTNDSSVVIFKLNGVTIKDNKNNPIKVKFTNNVASLNFTIPDGWRQKTLTVTAVTSIDGQRQEENTTFDIIKIGISLKNTNITRKNNTLTITTNLRDEHNHVVLGQNVFAIKINGVTYKENKKNKYFTTANSTLNANIKIPNSLLDKEFTIELVTGDRFSYLGTRQNYTVKV